MAFANSYYLTLTAGTAVSLFRFVTVASDGQADHVGTANTAAADAVSVEAQATVGEPFSAEGFAGQIVKLEAGAAVAVGDDVSSDSQGRGITATATAGNVIHGKALSAASAAGEIISVLLKGPYEIGA